MRIESICFHDNKKELKEAVRQLALSTAPTVFATAVFNDYASTDRARAALRYFHKGIDRKIFGKHFYQTAPNKRTFFIAFPENINSNLHYHLLIRPPQNKVERLIDVAPRVWEKICKQGDLKADLISTEEDLRKVSFYSTKDCFIEKNFANFIISSEFC